MPKPAAAKGTSCLSNLQVQVACSVVREAKHAPEEKVVVVDDPSPLLVVDEEVVDPPDENEEVDEVDEVLTTLELDPPAKLLEVALPPSAAALEPSAARRITRQTWGQGADEQVAGQS